LFGLLALFLRAGVPLAVGALLLWVFRDNPEAMQRILEDLVLPAGSRLIEVIEGSVCFVVEATSLSSLELLWKSYLDGSLRKKLKKAINEMKELKEVSKGVEIDVSVTIDEEEYREARLDLLSKNKGTKCML
jgi:hypothetical protein